MRMFPKFSSLMAKITPHLSKANKQVTKIDVSSDNYEAEPIHNECEHKSFWNNKMSFPIPKEFLEKFLDSKTVALAIDLTNSFAFSPKGKETNDDIWSLVGEDGSMPEDTN